MACYVHNFLLVKSYTCHVSSQTIAYTIYIGYIHIHHFQTFTLEQKGYRELLGDITTQWINSNAHFIGHLCGVLNSFQDNMVPK